MSCANIISDLQMETTTLKKLNDFKLIQLKCKKKKKARFDPDRLTPETLLLISDNTGYVLSIKICQVL